MQIGANVSIRRIKTEADLAEGAAWLAKVEPRFAAILKLTGPLPLRLRDGGFTALLRAIVSQQISVAAAAGVWAKMEAARATDITTVAAMDCALVAYRAKRPPMLWHLPKRG